MISVTILTKNSEKYLDAVLNALISFDDVVILDNGSSDQTIEIAKKFSNTRIFYSEFLGFGKLHNLASEFAKNEWILSIDSDEIVARELKEEILSLKLDCHEIYSFPRHTYYRNKLIKWCGWYPDRVIRIYNKNITRFSDDQVHEKIVKTDLVKEVCLSSPLIHYSYDSISDFLAKMQSYSQLFALQNKGKRSSSVFTAISHGFFAFVKSYFLKKGFLGGYEGFLISAYNAHTAFYKYLKLYEANHE